MTTNQVGTLHSQTGLGFGLGFETTDRVGANGLDPVGAYGWSGAYSSMYRVDPESNVVICFMVQVVPTTIDLGRKFPTLVYQALEP
jgi:CubicO group peptidase (beta-lactamase class C family)